MHHSAEGLVSEAGSSPRSGALLQRGRRVEAPVIRGWGSGWAPVLDRAAGSHVWDVDGRRYLDLSGSRATVAIGHSHPRVVARVREQAGLMMHCSAERFSAVRIDLLERLQESAPEGLDRVALATSGSSANELALRLGLAATGRRDVLCFSGGFHGNDGLARTLSARRRSNDVAQLSGGFRVHYAPFPDPATAIRDGRTLDDVATECLDHLEDRLADPYGGFGTPGVAFIEPIQGSAGIIVPPDHFLRRLLTICRRQGILLVADEVQTGFGRTGAMWAMDHLAERPDLLTFGKGVGGGLAMAGVLGRGELMAALPSGDHGTTFVTNALNLAAAAEALGVLRDEALVKRSHDLGGRLLMRCQEVLGPLQRVMDVRGRGLMVGVELADDRHEASTAAELASAVSAACRDRGILLSVSGRRRSVLKLSPPLVVSAADLMEAVDVIGQQIKANSEG